MNPGARQPTAGRNLNPTGAPTMDQKTAPTHEPETIPEDITTSLRAKTYEASWKYTAEDFALFKMAADLIDTLRAEVKTAIDAAHAARAEARTLSKMNDIQHKTIASLSAQSLKDQALIDLSGELDQFQRREITRLNKALERTRNQRNSLAETLEVQKAVLEAVLEAVTQATGELLATITPERKATATKEDPRK